MTLVAGAIFFLLGLFGVKYRPRLLAATALIFFYAFLSGANPSALRAALMCAVVAGTFFAQRNSLGFNAMGLAGVVSLLCAPAVLFDIGFELSYLSISALIAASQVFPLKRGKNAFFQGVKELFVMSLWVSLFILPVVSFYFSRVYLAAFLYNIILIPFCDLILMLVFVLLVIAPMGFFAHSLGAVLDVLINWFIAANKFLGDLPVSSCSFRFNGWLVAAYYLAFLVAVLFRRRYNETHEKN